MDTLPRLASNYSAEGHVKILVEASEGVIARIESQIAELERLRDQERETLFQLRAVIAPIRKVPVELLAEIFRYTCLSAKAVNGSRFRRYFWRRNVLRPAEVVSHVCAHWRRVAVTTPQLWTELLPSTLSRTPTDAYCTGLKEWLGRSAPLPIPVQLTYASGVDATAALGAFLAMADRWSDAHFALPSLSVLSEIPSDGLNQLHKLTLQSSDTSSPGLVAFLLAPNLTTVTLHTRHIARIQMPWSQLAHLTVGLTESAQECLDSLLQCHNLVTADFSMPAWPGRPDVSALTLVTLGKLESLELRSSSQVGSITPLFACLALPSLRCLTLSLAYELDWATPEFTRFQLRSPNIETLSINHSDLEADELMVVLRHSPALLKLTLGDCPLGFDETTAIALSSSHQSHAQLLPRLCSLSVDRCDHLEEDTLDVLIAARWWTDEQLATFPSPPRVSRWSYIFINRDDGQANLSPELEAKLEEYQEQGLSVTIY
ncbi:hypothetical protein C8R46DRAFT_1045755 [Mycena filopes]|nr:hypothetical protein C8R46DRAFT_1045755 [Mycena filopes]